MDPNLRRRSFIGGSLATMLGLAGCNDISRPPDSNELTENLQQQAGTGTPNATFIIGHRDGRTVSIDGTTGEIQEAAPAGEEDARVIQRTFDAIPNGGGGVFIENGTYEIGRYDQWNAGVKIHTSNTVVSSNFARLRFHEHSPEAEFLMDFAVGAVENVTIEGLIVDGNRTERSNPTRTIDISESSNVAVRDCVIFGGRRIKQEGGAGYGIGPYEVNHLTVTNCLITDSDRHGIHPGANDGVYRDVRIHGNTFIGNARNPTGAAIDVRDRTKDVFITGNYIAENGNGIRMKGVETGDVRISGNVVRENRNEEDASAQIEVVAKGFGRYDISENILVLESGGGEMETRQIFASPSGDSDSLIIRDNDVRGGDSFLEVRDQGALSYIDVVDNTATETSHGVIVEGVETTLVRDNAFRSIEEPAVLPERSQGAVVNNYYLDSPPADDLSERGFVTRGNLRL